MKKIILFLVLFFVFLGNSLALSTGAIDNYFNGVPIFGGYSEDFLTGGILTQKYIDYASGGVEYQNFKIVGEVNYDDGSQGIFDLDIETPLYVDELTNINMLLSDIRIILLTLLIFYMFFNFTKILRPFIFLKNIGAGKR